MAERTMTERNVTSVFGASYREVEIGKVVNLAKDTPMMLDCGMEIRDFPLAFQTYGTLNAQKSNAILVCHGLTGDQYVIGTHPVTGKSGWWENLIGPGKPIDTSRFFVIATNVIGGCMGSFGPKEINPATGEPWGLDFPVITIADMVRAQALLMDYLGIEQLFAVIGGSMGGMQVLEWAVSYPKRVCCAVPIATTTRHSAQNIAFHEIGRQAVMADPDWRNGNYLKEKRYPTKGLSVARMTAHITYLSEAALQRKFGRTLQERQGFSFGFDADFSVESYLRHQGISFVERFDANSYLYITRAMDYFDLALSHQGNLSAVFRNTRTHFCIVSFSSDWLFSTAESLHLVRALNASGASVSFAEIQTDKGHDAFLLDEPEFYSMVGGFLNAKAQEKGAC
jgi:homoserine O-acetyltransferase